jgi:calcium-dependent protein kinase
MGCGNGKKLQVIEKPHEEHFLDLKQILGFSNYYLILVKLYEKPFEKIYKVQHKKTGEIRLMRDIRLSEKSKHSYQEEMKLVSELDHPNILKIYEYFEDKESYQLITELVTGDQLLKKITKVQIFNEVNAAKIMKQLFSGVAYLHDYNVVHRDLNINNIYFENDNLGDYSIKIMYFGAARYLAKNEKLGDRATMNAHFMAPEVVRGKYDKKCDIWSLGVILYILLTGFYPYDGKDRTTIMEAVVGGTFCTEGHEWNSISPEALHLVKHLLAYNPEDRPQALEVINHPWIVKFVKEDNLKIPFINKINLHYIMSKRGLERAAINYLIHNLSTNSTVRQLRDIFKSLDKTGKGKLSYDVMKNAWKDCFKSGYSEAEFEQVFHCMENKQTHEIQYEDFLKLTVDMENLLSEKNLKQAFDFFDHEHDGYIGIKDVQHLLGVCDNMGETAAEIIKDFDKTGEDRITFEQFKSILTGINK